MDQDGGEMYEQDMRSDARLNEEELERLLFKEWGADSVTAMALVRRWLARGDAAAVYRNDDLGHPEAGAIKIVSFGSPVAQIEQGQPPLRLPDIGGDINWRYQLIGWCITDKDTHRHEDAEDHDGEGR